jgi:hypothetical protein
MLALDGSEKKLTCHVAKVVFFPTQDFAHAVHTRVSRAEILLLYSEHPHTRSTPRPLRARRYGKDDSMIRTRHDTSNSGIAIETSNEHPL